MHQHGNVSKSVSQHGMQTVNETLGMSNQTNSCHTLSQCRCSKRNELTLQKCWKCRKWSWLILYPIKKKVKLQTTKKNKKHFGWYEEQQHPWSCLKTVASNTEGLLVARKHLIWFFILLITAGSVAHLHCFSLSAPWGFYICLPKGIASLLLYDFH